MATDHHARVGGDLTAGIVARVRSAVDRARISAKARLLRVSAADHRAQMAKTGRRAPHGQRVLPGQPVRPGQPARREEMARHAPRGRHAEIAATGVEKIAARVRSVAISRAAVVTATVRAGLLFVAGINATSATSGTCRHHWKAGG